MKRVFIIHGWGGYPHEHWLPWLKRQLEKRGYQVEIPSMPETNEPKIDAWVSFLTKLVGMVDKETYFVGHSIGSQAVLRFLESLPTDFQAGGAVFVAGFTKLTPEATPDFLSQNIAKPWTERPIDWKKIKQVMKKVVAIFSDNDPDVPMSESNIFKEKLGAKILIEKNKGHFCESDGVKELPIVLEELLKMP